jgi:hypothetical protein
MVKQLGGPFAKLVDCRPRNFQTAVVLKFLFLPASSIKKEKAVEFLILRKECLKGFQTIPHL